MNFSTSVGHKNQTTVKLSAVPDEGGFASKIDIDDYETKFKKISEEQEFDSGTLIYAVKFMLNKAESGDPMTNEAIVTRLQAELDAHYLYR